MEVRTPLQFSPFQHNNPYAHLVVNSQRFRIANQVIVQREEIIPATPKSSQLSKTQRVYETSLEEIKKFCTIKTEQHQGVHLSCKKTSLGFAIEYSQAGIFGLLKTPIGQGSSKKVYLAVNLETKQMSASAVMILSKPKDKMKVVEKILMQKSFEDHPEFVKVLHYCEYPSKKNPSKQKISLMMEYCNSGSLENFISCKRPSNSSGVLPQIIQDLLSGLAVMEERKIHHRDIKPENILLHEADGILHAKFTDFGFAIHTDLEKQKSRRPGNPLYTSPEYFKGVVKIDSGKKKFKQARELKQKMLEGLCENPPDIENEIAGLIENAEELLNEGKSLGSSTKSDIWALGLIFYIFLCNENFYHDISSMKKLFKKLYKMDDLYIASRFIEFDLNHHFFAKFVFDMLQLNPEKRPLAKELLQRWKIKTQ